MLRPICRTIFRLIHLLKDQVAHRCCNGLGYFSCMLEATDSCAIYSQGVIFFLFQQKSVDNRPSGWPSYQLRWVPPTWSQHEMA